jgi:hypothetical protein
MRLGRSLPAFAFAATVVTACGPTPPTSSFSDAGGSGPAYDFRAHIVWTGVAASAWSGDAHGSAHLADVMTHTTDRFASSDPSTEGHETLHGLLAEQRNKTSAHDNFVYGGDGKGALVLEPSSRLSGVKDYVPAGARRIASGRYQTYLIDQARSWSEVLYVFDEWDAYTVGARVGVEAKRAGRWDQGAQDVVDGATDFLYFGAAAMLMLHEREPAFVQGNEQLKAAFALLAEATVPYVEAGLAFPEFSGFHARELLTHLRTSSEAAAIRAYLTSWYGADWTSAVLGF